MKSISLVMLVICGLSNTISAQIVYEPPAKKLIEFSWSSPFTNEYNNHSELYDSGPFDGISVKPSKEVGGGNIFMVENWKMINEEAKQREYNVVMEIGEKSTLKHNFLVLYGASQMDWFSDEHWNQAEAQLRYLANLAKIGNFKGILWDPEPYKPGKNPWKYEEQLQKDTYSYYDYYVQVRKRGA